MPGAAGIGGTGQGFPANPGDATWDASSYACTLWNNPAVILPPRPRRNERRHDHECRIKLGFNGVVDSGRSRLAQRSITNYGGVQNMTRPTFDIPGLLDKRIDRPHLTPRANRDVRPASRRRE